MKEEPIFTEQDMEIARNAFAMMKQQRDEAQMIAWCIVKAAGGKVEIPASIAVEAVNWRLERYETPDFKMVIRCV